MSQESDQQERRGIWKIGAIGCLGMLVLVGLAVAWGSYEAYKTIEGAQKLTERTGGASVFVRDFLTKLDEDPEAAAKMMAPGVEVPKPTAEQATLRAGRKPSRYKVMFLSADGKESANLLGSILDWRFVYQYLQNGKVAQGTPVLRLSLSVHATSEQPERFEVTSATYEQATIELAQEAPARAVKQFQDVLSKGGPSAAYLLTTPKFQEETTLQAFETFVSKQGAAFKLGSATIQEIEYLDDDNARVIATLKGPSSSAAVFEYSVARQLQFAWLVAGARAVVATTPK